MALESLIAHAESVLTLPELVDVANELLPALLPKDAAGRVAEDVNPRLVRHYTTLGLLPEPRKEGREARYLYEHLLRLLVVRRLLAEGYSSQALGQLLTGLDDSTLVNVLDGGVELRLVPAKPAEPTERLAFLERVRRSAGLPPAAETGEASARAAQALRPQTAVPAPQAPAVSRSERAKERVGAAKKLEVSEAADAVSLQRAFNETSWTSFTVADGLELFVRSDFSLPATRLGDEQLLDLLKMLLLNLEQRQRSKP